MTSISGADIKRVNKPLTMTLEPLSIYVKQVKFERGNLAIGLVKSSRAKGFVGKALTRQGSSGGNELS